MNYIIIAVTIALFYLLLSPTSCYSKPYHDVNENSELKSDNREEKRDLEDEEKRKKEGEDRRKMFLERKKARENGEPDPVEVNLEEKLKSEEANRKKNGAGKGDADTKSSGSGGKTNGRNNGETGSKSKNLPPTTVATTTTTTTTEDPNTKRGNADERTDAALGTVKNMLLTDEPMETGEAGPCKNCNLFGVSTVERIGRATAIDLDDDRKRVKVYLGLRNLTAICNCTYGASGVVTASVKKLVIYLDVTVNFETDDTDITNVTIKFPGQLDFDFDGHGFIGWIYEIFLGLFRTKIMNELQKAIINEIPKLVHEHKDHLHHIGMI